MKIFVPSSLSVLNATNFLLELEKNVDDSEVVIDFSPLGFALPAGTMLLASGIRNFVRQRQGGGLSTKVMVKRAQKAQSYLMHVGFFQFIGIKIGNAEGEATGSFNYKPITRVRKSEIILEAAQENVREIDIILERADQLAGWFTSSFNQSEYRAVSYAIRELIRNVFDHAQTNQFFYLGQKYANGAVEIVLMDEGRGLLESLKEAFPITSDQEAIELAIKPGATRRSGGHPMANVSDNSGFGLFVLSELGRSFGTFTLASGNSSAFIKKNISKIVETNHSGTFISLRLESFPRQWSALLDDIVTAGEEEAKVLGLVSKASSLSKADSKKTIIQQVELDKG